MKKVLYVATVLSHICQFHLPYLQMFKEQGYEVHVAARDNLAEKNGLKLQYADRHFEIPFRRSPFSPKNIAAYKKLKKLIDKERYDLIICNTPVGGIVTRMAAKKARKNGTKVVYIAHGFHFYKGAPKKNWLVYYPIEKHFAKYCDTVVTIVNEDYLFARQHLKTNIVHIHGIGVSSDRYHSVETSARMDMRARENIQEEDFVILCTGELNKNKDQKTLLQAAENLKDKIGSLKILLAGNGPLRAELEKQVSVAGLENIVRFLGYRTDLENIVPAVDLVVSCSHREGLPLNIIEALLCKKIVVASINRGHKELIQDGGNGYLFRSGDWDTLSKRILEIYQADKQQLRAMEEKGYELAQKYTIVAVEKELKGTLSLY